VNGVYQHDHFFLALRSQSQTQSLLLGRTRRAFVAATLGVTGCSRLDYAPGVFSVAGVTVDVPAAPSFHNCTLCGAVFSSKHRIELKRRLIAGYLPPLEARDPGVTERPSPGGLTTVVAVS
jgi:hypothetical protein